MKKTQSKREKVILYSTSFHSWEVWMQGQPLAHGSLDSCMQAFPDALPVAAGQIRLAHHDQAQAKGE